MLRIYGGLVYSGLGLRGVRTTAISPVLLRTSRISTGLEHVGLAFYADAKDWNVMHHFCMGTSPEFRVRSSFTISQG